MSQNALSTVSRGIRSRSGKTVIGYFERASLDGFFTMLRAPGGAVEYVFSPDEPNLPSYYKKTTAPLQSRRSCPIASLPVELLIMIFHAYIEAQRSSLAEDGAELDIFPHLKLAHICKFWRGVVEKVPEFWTFLDSRSTLSVEHCSVLSKDMPLSLRVWEDAIDHSIPPEQRYERWPGITHQDRHRIEYFEFWPRPGSTNDLVTIGWWTQRASVLKKMTYFSGTNATANIPVIDKGETAAPVETLACYGPRGVSTLASMFSNTITTLVISAFHRSSIDRDVLRGEYLEFVGALKVCPNLTNLELSSLDLSPVAHGPMERVTVPKLQDLRIVDNSQSIFTILASINYPNSAEVKIQCSDTVPLAFTVDALGAVIVEKLTGLRQVGPHAPIMSVDLNFFPHPNLRVWVGKKDKRGTELTKAIFSFLFDGPPGVSAHMTQCVLDLMNSIMPAIKDISAFSVGPYGPRVDSADEVVPHASSVWTAVQQFKNVDEIQLIRTDNHGLHDLLIGRASDPEPPFPNLKALTLTGCGFVSTSCDCGEHPELPSPPLEGDAQAELDLLGRPMNATIVCDTAGVRFKDGKPKKLDEIILCDSLGLCPCNIDRMKALADNVIRITTRHLPGRAPEFKTEALQGTACGCDKPDCRFR
ncbi:hypothetical protein EIP91_005442 [Steccherinum ochraceum]|uniref:F-box domain-containing protein n=1 Tax=Steccherinum ochraceum TaxID=92696 RepID=A0A4R0RUG1_9APHY|nr:hypothetical protein EIP91_005442 [Steccherinum ochraceum]